MALPAQLRARPAGDGYLRLEFVQGDEVMANSHGYKPADILLAYPRQGQMMRGEGEQTREEKRAAALNEALVEVNNFLAGWCS